MSATPPSVAIADDANGTSSSEAARKAAGWSPFKPGSQSQPLHPPPPTVKEHIFEVVDGQAQIKVFDTLELRSAFLHYCHSIVRPHEMHRIAGTDTPHLNAQNLIAMCRDLQLVEPQGPLALMTLAILYTTLDKDEDKGGLTYSQFLDALMELAFECCCNVAGQLQQKMAAKMKAEPAVERARPARQSSQLLMQDMNSSGILAADARPGSSQRRMSEAGPQRPATPTRRLDGRSESGLLRESWDANSLRSEGCRAISVERRERFHRVGSMQRSPSLQGQLSILGPAGHADDLPAGVLRQSCPSSPGWVGGQESKTSSSPGTLGSRPASAQRHLRPSIGQGRAATPLLHTHSHELPAEEGQGGSTHAGAGADSHPLHAALLSRRSVEVTPTPRLRASRACSQPGGADDDWGPGIPISVQDLVRPEEQEGGGAPRAKSVSSPGQQPGSDAAAGTGADAAQVQSLRTTMMHALSFAPRIRPATPGEEEQGGEQQQQQQHAGPTLPARASPSKQPAADGALSILSSFADGPQSSADDHFSFTSQPSPSPPMQSRSASPSPRIHVPRPPPAEARSPPPGRRSSQRAVVKQSDMTHSVGSLPLSSSPPSAGNLTL